MSDTLTDSGPLVRMSNSTSSPTATRTHSTHNRMPRAILHKKVLDVAVSRPDASLEELADEVSGATVSIVEQVLEEYGDPGETAAESAASSGDGESEERDSAESALQGEEADGAGGDERGVAEQDVTVGVSNDEDADPGTETEASADENEDQRTAETIPDQDCDDDTGETPVSTDGAPTASDTATNSTMTTDNSTDSTPDVPTDPTALTPRQRETLQEIAARPDATQAALAETLGVTSATISQRVNSIDGFEWSRRREFVANLFDDEDSAVAAARDHEGAGESDSSAEATVDGERVLESEPESVVAGNGNGNENENGDGNVIENESGAESVDSDADSAASEASDAVGDGAGQGVAVSESESESESEAGSERSDEQSTGNTYESRRFDRQDTQTQADEPAETPDAAAGSGSETGARTELGTDTHTHTIATDIAALAEQLESLESTVQSASSDRQGCLADPEFAHKVLRACFDAEHITEEDEVRLLREIAGEGGDSSVGSAE
ncbi:HTH domain protein [Natrialba magadii ATCC 43099]|uniref:HTH domain protein n=2 Tax=Natrialba magadii (strain ATCC 43099 / DSM 3394 / CCM 3739 / CIP 104546 / IAM 13178 / JCM 8861 / NBRC 102185 / NCIMB 2190 / MS3) TaxID=547559 RepID=D3SVW8_NATMM|nr:HTH domain protein [Natrialba magadii ATCC 43099]